MRGRIKKQENPNSVQFTTAGTEFKLNYGLSGRTSKWR